MRKWLAILTGIALISAVVLVARYDQNYTAGKEGYEIQCRQPSQPPAAEAPLTCKIYSGQNAAQGQPSPPWWHKLIAWPEGITAWLLLFTLGGIAWQAWATADAAKAAQEQAKHMITSERAWIIVSSRFPDGHHPVKQGPVTRFRWEFKNVGKSPARLLEFDGVAQRADRWNTSFPDPPRFVDRAEPLNRLLLVPNDSWGITWMVEGDALSIEEFASLRDYGETTLISYGYVKYLDAFGGEHTTRFCQEFWFDKESKEGHFTPRIQVPSSYTDCD